MNAFGETGYRAWSGVMSRWRNFYYRRLGVRIPGYVWMRRIEIPRNWTDITLGHCAKLDTGVVLLCSGAAKPDKLVVGDGTYVNRYTIFDAHDHLQIGEDCMIGPHCYFTDADHGFMTGMPVQTQPMRIAPVVIGPGAWIGAGAIILAGARVGQGAVIGAGSVVKGEIPANQIAVGVPAKIIKPRPASM